MRTSAFDITNTPPSAVVASTLTGFFSLDTTTDYVREAERVIGICFARHRRYRMLLDLSSCAIQSQDVVAAFLAHVQRMPVAEKWAVIVGRSIVRMQIRRVMNRPNVRLFESREEALHWIDQPTRDSREAEPASPGRTT